MIGSGSVMQALPWILAIGLMLASLRLLLGLRRLPAGSQPRAWRTGLLLLGQCTSAALLFLLLRASTPGDSIHTLHLLTAHAPSAITPTQAGGELWLRLPEATPRHGIESTPDLATALRRHPRVRTLHVIGDGLQARDRDAASGLQVHFEPAPLASGVREWWAPQSLHQGDPVAVRGAAPGGTRIELLDPAGMRIDRQALQADGAFALRATARSPGISVYQLRLHDASGKALATTQVPVQVVPAAPTRLLLRSGGPDPELKFLRRWAADNGATLQATIDLGAGMQAGDPPFSLYARTLADADVLILDDRSWNGLGHSRRATVLEAVGKGMGLLLRTTAALADGDALGLQVRAASLPSRFKLPVVDANPDDPPPTLTRPPLRIDNPSGQTVLRDDSGNPLAAWRIHGRGRIGVWLPIDSFTLVLAGHADLHARLWADALNAVSRARAPAMRDMPALVYAGERTTICGLGKNAHVVEPDGSSPLMLAIDPRTGDDYCAAFWPEHAGWHRLVDGALADSASDTAFLVRASDADPVLRAARTQRATALLASSAAARSAPASVASSTPTPARTASTSSLPRWALFLLWLTATNALWWFERSRLGRIRTATPA